MILHSAMAGRCPSPCTELPGDFSCSGPTDESPQEALGTSCSAGPFSSFFSLRSEHTAGHVSKVARSEFSLQMTAVRPLPPPG